MEKTYTINRKNNESKPDFYTRVANEIKTMSVKIIGFDIGNNEAKIIYIG
jgi:hypothetical protein